MSKGKIIILSGPSGSGKTTLHKRLIASRDLNGKIIKSISATTRPMRSDEKNGRDYLFLTKAEFEKKIKAGYFLEWQRVFENYYGTPREKVEELLVSGKNVLLCIDVKGAAVVLKDFPDAITIFITAPSFDILKERLLTRGTESNEDIKNRLEIARKELQESKHYEHILVNDQLDQTVHDLEQYLLEDLKIGPKGKTTHVARSKSRN